MKNDTWEQYADAEMVARVNVRLIIRLKKKLGMNSSPSGTI